MLPYLIYAGVGLVLLLIIGLMLARLYKRASKEIGFVRTGFGGEKVVINGGALVLPVFHETMPVNMNTVRLAVERKAGDALITLDRLRIDVKAEFYVRVKPDAQAIATAAQTLGLRTMHPEALKELVEGKFVDALRSVAAGMTMAQLHEQRADFVQKVQQVSSVDLAMNGLELESVSLTGLDQTSIEHFNANNAFDAEGLTKLTEVIELRRKKRNEIEQDTEVQVQRKNLEAQQQRLQIARHYGCEALTGEAAAVGEDDEALARGAAKACQRLGGHEQVLEGVDAQHAGAADGRLEDQVRAGQVLAERAADSAADPASLTKEIAAALSAIRPRVILALRPAQATLHLSGLKPAWPGDAVRAWDLVALGCAGNRWGMGRLGTAERAAVDQQQRPALHLLRQRHLALGAVPSGRARPADCRCAAPRDGRVHLLDRAEFLHRHVSPHPSS